MKIRILTDQNFIDVETLNVFTEEKLLEGLEQGAVIALPLKEGNVFVLNSINVVAVEIIKEANPPPIQ